jgi:hypothetical protein
MRVSSICLFHILFVFNGFAQATDTTIIRPSIIPVVDTTLKHTTPFLYTGKLSVTVYTINTIPANYYNNTLGFVCRKEWLVEQKTKVPLRLRLGSLAYTDAMEQKAGAKPLLPATTIY